MKLLNNMKMKTKFLASFILLCIIMVVVGVIGILNMNTINNMADTIYSNNYLSTVNINNFKSNFQEIRLYTQRAVLEEYAADMETNIQKVLDLASTNDTYLADYEALLAEDEDKELFATLQTDLASYRTLRDQVFELARAGDHDGASALYLGDQTTAALKALEDLDALTEYNLQSAQNRTDEAASTYSSSFLTMIIIIVVAAAFAIVLGFVMANIVTKPLNHVGSVADSIAHGNLVHLVDHKVMEHKDEIGALARSVREMRVSLLDTVSGIKDSAISLGNQIDSNNTTLGILNDRITDTSAATEELSAGMEETGAAAEEMNATAAEIERAVENVAEKAGDGAVKAGEIYTRADSLGNDVTNSKNKANNMFTEIKEHLEKALEESKAVNEINVLADAILQITSQTNLLALNASIEAARAGEAGKGFAVVANEISNLADSSKNTAGQIQEITRVVMSAVGNLSQSSNNLLDFMANNVSKDYENMIVAADSYRNDATYVSDMTSDLNATSEELLASLQVMMRAISEVASSAQEGAKTTTMVAEQTGEIASNAATIVTTMNDTDRVSKELTGLVAKFKTEN